MSYTAQEALQDILDAEANGTITEDLYDRVTEELKDLVFESPLQATAYATIAHCMASVGEPPSRVLDFFILALSINTQNPVIWNLLARFAKKQARHCTTDLDRSTGDKISIIIEKPF